MRPSSRLCVAGLAMSCISTDQIKRRAGVTRQVAEHEANVDKHIALGVVFGRLLAADGGRQLRQHLGQQPALVQQVEPARGVRRAEQFQQLIADALGAHFADGDGVLLHGGERRRGDLEPKLRGEAHGTEQAQSVFAKAFRRVADGADAPSVEIGLATDPVVQSRRREDCRNSPLMVKSRRMASSRASVNRTLPGRRPSV